ncbi:ATP-dependent DNA helicase RecG [Mycetocola manganoxydans]|uniref:Probable DNA 3'-5' helicase RecG n=1 Tax=Mycetocola manganoxydans TaxID=699879 RepID=A0A3L6ZJS9_9MICO|nr:ATP-dependent DNA helicase RecG [Mycetocola manganoxydans]RLP67945.1 ATP-dependent DNA helicase RecG [Mycetocola manganoxydans]GHD38552.1 ATP-dependent DNA helicase RecG [Mycetocola manganoxydans]
MPTDPTATKLDGVLGGRTASAFKRAFGVVTVGDLLEHYPRRYATRGELTALSRIPVGENVTIVAEVLDVRERPMKARRGSILEVRITDGQGILILTFFNQSWRSKELAPGVRGIFAGKVGDYKGALQLAHPDYELFDAAAQGTGADAARKWAMTPIPIYPATASVASWQVAKAMSLVLDSLDPLPDPLPHEVRERENLLGYSEAIEKIHRPQTDADWHVARDTLRHREAFLLQAALLQQRQIARFEETQPRVPSEGGLLERFDAALPFTLTGDQQDVGREIADDLASAVPMNRLVQGEVGSGKTLVALRAMLTVAESGGQAALLAPTEVLAGQHLRSIVKSLGPDLSAILMPTLLTGQMPAAERRKAMLRIVSGQAKIVIGTHALLSENVTFYDLGLVVVDEQHRFGVEQRETLRQKGHRPPHVLVLTATPIPRTVAMTVFGDLDVSTIRELPAGRAGIETFVVGLVDHPAWIHRVWTRVAEEVAAGRQAFVVCPAIDVGEPEDDGEPAVDAEPAEPEGKPERPRATVAGTLAELTTTAATKSLRLAALHGRMPSDEKDATMRLFAAGGIDVLVATTVIEVGVDVPNAAAMVVLDADRFGVSQLHQLRGRVGRGGLPGLCLLVTAAEPGSIARERVDAVAATLDGFELAQVDLELRQEGDVLGSAQSGGRSSLKLLRVVHDGDLIALARSEAAAVLDSDPALSEHPVLRAALEQRVDAVTRAALAKN